MGRSPTGALLQAGSCDHQIASLSFAWASSMQPCVYVYGWHIVADFPLAVQESPVWGPHLVAQPSVAFPTVCNGARWSG